MNGYFDSLGGEEFIKKRKNEKELFYGIDKFIKFKRLK